MKNRCSGYSSDSEKNKQKEDLSVLRKPIYTALSGFLEAKKAYENGTEEIRRLLVGECDIIYECNECRNIFRSLTNFISHKRVYCRNSHSHFSNNNYNFQNKGFIDQDISTIIQAEQDYVKKCETGNKETVNKDLSSIIERLLQREQANRLMNLTDFYEQVNNKLTQDEVLKRKHTLQLDNVPNSSVAVYQTIKNKDSDNIRAEVNELDELLNNDHITLGPDGKILQKKNVTNTAAINNPNSFVTGNNATIAGTSSNINNDPNSSEIICDICHISFTTEKTLKLHIQTKHIASTYVYQCPSCSQTFLQPAAVIRHLVGEHNKTNRKVRVMRDSILKRRVRIDEVQIKGPSRELARLQTDKEKKAADDKAWLDNFEGGNDSPMCTFCGKSFDRKAVLTTHLTTCPSKDKSTSLVTKKSMDIAINSKQQDVTTVSPENSKFNSNSTDLFLNEFEQKFNLNDDSLVPAEPKKPEMATNRRKRRKAPKKSIIKNDDIDPDTLNEMFMNLGKDTDSLKLNTVSLDNLDKICNDVEKNSDSEPSVDDKDKEQIVVKPDAECALIEGIEKIEIESVAAVVKSRPKKSGKLIQKELSCFCKICKKKFDALSNLRRHISMFHYRSRNFGCTICEYRAFRRYDVINHLSGEHLISGERETIIKYVTTHEEKISRDGMDEDIVVITPNGSHESIQRSTIKKRSRRSRLTNKPSIPITKEEPTVDNPSTSIDFIEPITNGILKPPTRPLLHEPKLTRGRPIRNRVKPVNKDFLYDLSNILKKDTQYVDKESVIRKRRSTNSVDEICSTGLLTSINNISTEYALFAKGAALKMAKAATICGRAKFGTYNELSFDGSPRKPIIIINSDNDEPESKNEFQRYVVKPSLSEHSMMRKYSKRRRLDLSGRARLPLIKKSTISTLFNRVDVNMNGDNKPSSTNEHHMDLTNGNHNELSEERPQKNQPNKYPLEKDFENFLITSKIKTQFVDPSTSIPNKTSPPTASEKRVALFQRLKHNNNKKIKDSLLRSALEH